MFCFLSIFEVFLLGNMCYRTNFKIVLYHSYTRDQKRIQVMHSQEPVVSVEKSILNFIPR